MAGQLIGVLADNNFGDTREGGLAGPTGLVIILLLVIGTVLLIRNMNARLRRLPRSFDPPGGFDPHSPDLPAGELDGPGEATGSSDPGLAPPEPSR